MVILDGIEIQQEQRELIPQPISPPERYLSRRELFEEEQKHKNLYLDIENNSDDDMDQRLSKFQQDLELHYDENNLKRITPIKSQEEYDDMNKRLLAKLNGGLDSPCFAD